MKNLFINDIRKVAISNNNIEKFDVYLLREGKYKVSLPVGWEIDDNSNSYININFNDGNDIYGNISITNGDIETICNDIAINKDDIKIVEDDSTWHIINKEKDNTINKYYLRDYSEGKVLMIKYSYIKGNEKNSINVVFDSISKSFQ
ncbi:MULTISPECIES: hypothetical protein [unclassified Clostridium]|uniref:hypothetical protein n=1 Tax=unclassified Clostridium TaxID=2614128 RepID=UPI001FAC9CF8|nr:MULTISPECIES: hypothetical protein [unclassified Clostridium]MCR1951037.1 hypothetical protein [Clostridium sp. DSM 100503]